MKLQLACDYLSLEEALELLEKTAGEADIIEIGTDMLYRYGIRAVQTIKSRWPDKPILADIKAIDGGYELGRLMYEAGADYFTVAGAAPAPTIRKAAALAREWRRKVCVDTTGIGDDLEKARGFVESGADLVCVHVGHDENGAGLAKLAGYCEAIGAGHCSVAGRLDPERLRQLLPYRPGVAIVGGYITRSADPAKAIKEIRSIADLC